MRRRHIAGLDTLRFFAALWVAMGHGAVPPLTAGHDPTQGLAWALNGFYSASISGPSAVILFFVISGFCIHYPYASGGAFDPRAFLIRRSVRILVPMVAAVALARALGVVAPSESDVLAGVPAWSLVAELIYYALYPLLRAVSRRVSWVAMCGIAFIAGLALALTEPIDNVNYPAWGYALDWVLGLPCWLMGVVLAGRVACGRELGGATRSRIWALRVGAVVLGAIATNLALQRIVGHHLTLNFFAIYATWWLAQEIRYSNGGGGGVSPLLEWAGRWSYSLYLMHITAFALFHRHFNLNLGHMVNWAICLAFPLLLSVVFYYLCEAPSHRLARKLSLWGAGGGHPGRASGVGEGAREEVCSGGTIGGITDRRRR